MKYWPFHGSHAVDINGNKRQAFTLIELLVVIAIISLLVSILLPSLQKARDLAKKVACMANLKSISVAFCYYQEEYNGLCPPGRLTATSNSCWFSLISGNIPYSFSIVPPLLAKETLICPAMTEGGNLYLYCYNWAPWKNIGYTYNYSASNKNVSNCNNPSSTPLVFDGRSLYATGIYGYDNWLAYSQPLRHEEGLNFLFLDTHIEYYQETELEKDIDGFNKQFAWQW